MASIIQPVKNWTEKTSKKSVSDESVSSLLDRCIGDEDHKDSCVEKDDTQSGLVSIRCRRHKKRFNVPVTWLRTCAWLCPKCYRKLTPQERARYAPPSKSHGGDIRPADNKSLSIPMKITLSPLKTPENDFACKDYEHKTGHSKAKRAKSEKAQAPTVNGEEPISELTIKKIADDFKASGVGMSDALAALIPKFRIKCKKCKNTVPCHKSWFDNSMVLCPSCYSLMTPKEIRQFHIYHPKSTATVYEIDPEASEAENETKKDSMPSPDRWSPYGGACSNDFIMSASKQELIKAVKSGKVSKARARIELNRRKNRSYFNDMPDINVRIVPT